MTHGAGGAWAMPRPPANDPNFICFEPLAAIVNGLNLAHRGLYKELQSIPAKAASEAFLAVWKDADADIPILKSARAEYARL